MSEQQISLLVAVTCFIVLGMCASTVKPNLWLFWPTVWTLLLFVPALIGGVLIGWWVQGE